jgi:hypothetical protein
MVLCSSCNGIPVKFKKKNGRASSLTAWIVETPLRIRWTIPLRELEYEKATT